jgi:hypothetical protein
MSQGPCPKGIETYSPEMTIRYRYVQALAHLREVDAVRPTVR